MICIATGWCADKILQRNTFASQSQYDPKYFEDVFMPYHKNQVKEKEFCCFSVYHSRCEVFLNNSLFGEKILSMQYSVLPVKGLDHRHDWFSSVMSGAQYALCNSCDLVYIEQDCLVWGLDKAIEWAKGKKIVYGFGEYSFQPGWAEHSFFYVDNGYLPTFLNALNGCRAHESTGPLPELMWQSLFGHDAAYWPFGYGRKRPIDFSQFPVYAQQLKDFEIEQFKRLGGLE